jgi:hypothetical protein
LAFSFDLAGNFFLAALIVKTLIALLLIEGGRLFGFGALSA